MRITEGEINVRLTGEEQEALSVLSQMQELTPEKVMIQALRLYQLVTMGCAKVEFPKDEDEVDMLEVPDNYEGLTSFNRR